MFSKSHSGLPANHDAQSLSVVLECLERKLARSGFQWQPPESGAEERDPELMEVVRSVFDPEDAHFTEFCNTNLDFEMKVDIAADNARDVFISLAEQAYAEHEEEDYWFLTIEMLVFAGIVARDAARRNHTDKLMAIVMWAVAVMRTDRVKSFMEKEGGWPGFVRRYRPKREKRTVMSVVGQILRQAAPYLIYAAGGVLAYVLLKHQRTNP